jgi:hypothetical protein
MNLIGPEQARKNAHEALGQSWVESGKLAFGAWVAVTTVMGGFLAIAAANGWVKAPGYVAALVASVVMLPLLLLFFEFMRHKRCASALREVLRAEIVYEDLLRDAREERNLAKRQLDEALSEYEVRISLLKAHYVRAMLASEKVASDE